MKAKRIFPVIALISLGTLAGCSTTTYVESQELRESRQSLAQPKTVQPTYSGSTSAPTVSGSSHSSATRAQSDGIRFDELRVIPGELLLDQGQRQAIAFSINGYAPTGGLYVKVTTNAPESVIMPEVIIPEGARTVNVTIEGGSAGSGKLFIEALGYEEVIIPITVR